MKKRFYLIIFTLLLTITLVACTPKNTYKLTLPEFVTSDVSDINKVLDETLVTLTVSERDGFVLDELKANDVLLNVFNNKATFIMKEDTVISVSFSVLGEGVYYKLTLGENITVNISNLDKILENTTIVIKVNVPEGKLIDQFLVNNVKETLNDNNEFTFDIKSNSNITVTFKDDPNKELDVVDILLLIKNLNPEILKSSDVNNFSFNIIDEDYGNEIDIKLLIDLNPEIGERIFYYLFKETYAEDSEYVVEQYGKNSKLYKYEDYEEETVVNNYLLTDSGISLLLSSTFNLGDFIIHPTALNNAIKTLFTMFKDDINEDSIIKDIKGKKIDDTYELKLSFGNESFDDFYHMFGEFYFENIDEDELEKIREQYESFQIDFTVLIKDNNIVGFLVDFEMLEYKGKLSYTTTTNNIDFEYIDIDKAISIPGYNVKIYDNDDLLLEINEEEDIDYLNEINFYYKEGLKFEGLYFDKELTKPFDNRALVEELVLYIKYSELITIDEYRERIGEEWAFVNPNYSNYYYYENSDYLLIKYISDDIFVLDKENNKGYLNSNGEYLLVDGNNYLKSIRLDINLKSFINSEFILIANNYFNKDNINNFINEREEIYYEGNTYKLLTDDELTKYSDFDFDEFLENEFMEDRIVYFEEAMYLTNDLDNLELFMDSLFIVQYSSDIRMELTLKELSKNHEVSIIHSDEEGIVNVEITIDQIKLYYRVLNYKSSKGLALYKEHVQEEQLFYYNDIKDFDELLLGEKSDFMKIVGIVINEVLVSSLEEIKQFEDLKIVRFSLAYNHNSLEEIINNLKDKTINLYYGEVYYDFSTNILYLRGPSGPSSLEEINGKFIIRNYYSSIEFSNDENGVKFLSRYFKDNHYRFDEYFTFIKILKGEINLTYNQRYDYYENEDYILDVGFSLGIRNKKSYMKINVDITDIELSIESGDLTEKSTIVNDLNSDIYTIRYNDNHYLYLEYFNIFLGYNIIGLFFDGELVDNEISNSKDYLIKYEKVKSPNEFFKDLSEAKGIIFNLGNGYNYKITPGLQQELYINGRLAYLVRKENNQYLSYYIKNDIAYVLNEHDYVLNILLLIDLYKDLEFVIEDDSYINEEKKIEKLEKVIYSNQYLALYFDDSYYNVELRSIYKNEFEPIDIKDFTVKNEEVEDVYIEAILSFDEILLDKDYPMITLEYNWGGIKKVSLEYLIENYNLTYQIDKEGLIIQLLDNNITKEFILSIYDSSVYGKIIIFNIDYNEYFVYLEDILDFNYLDKIKNGVFSGFRLNNKEYKTIEELENVISSNLSNDRFNVEILYEMDESLIRENLKQLILSMNLTTEIHFKRVHYDYNNKISIFEDGNEYGIRYIKENELTYDIYLSDSFFIINKGDIINNYLIPINYLDLIFNEDNELNFIDNNRYLIYDSGNIYEIRISDNFDKYVIEIVLNYDKVFMYERSNDNFDIDLSIKEYYQLKINVRDEDYLITEILVDNNQEESINTLYYIEAILNLNQELFSEKGINVLHNIEHYLELLEDDEFDLFLDALVIEVDYFNELDYDNHEIIYQMSNVQVLNRALGYLVDENGIVISFNDYYTENKLQYGSYEITFKINNFFNEYQLNIITAVSVEINYEIEIKYDNKAFDEIINSEKPSYETPFKAEPIIISNIKFYINHDGEYQRNIYIVNENNQPEINEHNSILIYYKNDLYEDLESYLDDEFYTVKIILKGVREDTNEWYADILEIN